MLEEKLTMLRKELIEYGTLVEYMIEQTITGLVKKDRGLLNGVIEKEEKKANDTEIAIEEICITMIAQFEPKAKDLRTILMGLKINNDLERVADHAVNIAEGSLFLIERPFVKPFIDIPHMAYESIGMLKDSIDAFVKESSQLAYDVCGRDSIVDSLEEQILRELITYMTADPSTIERSMKILAIAKNLERIADLSTNISEDVIYMVDGRTIKHHSDKD
jgi:phosphate transport system protein